MHRTNLRAISQVEKLVRNIVNKAAEESQFKVANNGW